MKRLLRISAVIEQTGLSRPTIYLRIKQGLWPRPIKIGLRASAWPESEVSAINTARISGSGNDEIKILVAELEQRRQIRELL